MKKLLSSIIGGALGLTLAVGVGIGVAAGNNAEFKQAEAATSTITFSNMGSSLSTTAVTTETAFTVSNYGFKYNNGKKQDNAIFLTNGTGYFYNTSAMPGSIAKISVTTNTNAAAACSYSLAFSVSAITGKYTTGATSYVIGKNASHEYTCSVNSAKYFCISVSSANGQVLNLTVTYNVKTSADHAGTSADPYTVEDARTAIDNNLTTTGVYTSGKISRITSYSGTYHSITYWISDDGTTGAELEIYGGKGLNNANFNSKDDIIVGAAVVVYGNLTKYNSIYEYEADNYMTYYNAEGVEIPDYIPEPAIETRTLAQFISGENTKTVAYLVTAEIKSFGTSSNSYVKDKYGNMTLTDGTNDLIIYGATMHTSALTWDSIAGEYSFSNPQKFLTDTYTNNLAVGNTITMILVRCDYINGNTTKIEGCGVIILSCSGYAKIFLQSMTCDATGATAPTFSRTWQDLSDMFDSLPEAEQGELTGATADPSGNVITQAVARYDMVVGKYGYTDFMGRNPASGANRMKTVINDNSVVIITIVAVISAAALATFFILRKKKEA